jgi:hypothetical protein
MAGLRQCTIDQLDHGADILPIAGQHEDSVDKYIRIILRHLERLSG